jgi:hypothetical protein
LLLPVSVLKLICPGATGKNAELPGLAISFILALGRASLRRGVISDQSGSMAINSENRPSTNGFARSGTARRGGARQGVARLSLAWHGEARQGMPRRDVAGQGVAWFKRLTRQTKKD